VCSGDAQQLERSRLGLAALRGTLTDQAIVSTWHGHVNPDARSCVINPRKRTPPSVRGFPPAA
jgi:hypothetical protein